MESFNFEGKDLPVVFIETVKVAEGVACDVYTFVGDNGKDLGIITIRAGGKTPRQKVLRGDKTIEGYISGKGRLVITKPDGGQKVYIAGGGLGVEVAVGETMQWQADADSNLVAYEICFPPYKEGRFENLS